MNSRSIASVSATLVVVAVTVLAVSMSGLARARGRGHDLARATGESSIRRLTVRWAAAHDRSQALVADPLIEPGVALRPPARSAIADAPRGALAPQGEDGRNQDATIPRITSPLGAAAVEQRVPGSRPSAALVTSFNGLGVGFVGPHGEPAQRNPSDNTLAVGRNHIVQIVNTRMAIFTKKGRVYDTTGTVLYGAVPTNNVFKDFGGPCELRNNGDAVVRYDQLADRWLIVMPIFSRGPVTIGGSEPGRSGSQARRSQRGRAGQPGPPAPLVQHEPSALPPDPAPVPAAPPPQEQGDYAMCYAVSVGPDPFGPYYRYEFVRPLFPDYPRPAVWPDGYYVPTSTGDDVIEKHACVADRTRMLRGESASEQCFVIADVNFLNNADLDGTSLPPPGAPNIMLAAGGTQLRGRLADSVLYVWAFHVDWNDISRTRLDGPALMPVAPYQYLCGGQLTNCVPQPGVERRLDAQGDKLMARVVYRRVKGRELVVAAHSVNTLSGGGGVRWYELEVASDRSLRVRQQGTYAPDSAFRWMASPAMDRFGNIGIGYSFGSASQFPGQRFAGRRAGDVSGALTLREQVLVTGGASQTSTLRWEDYTQTAIDPRDDCTIWYVGDYLRAGATAYSTKIGAFRLPGCTGTPVRTR